MNCSHRCDAPHIFKIVTICMACKYLVLPNCHIKSIMTVRHTLWLPALWMLCSMYFSTCVYPQPSKIPTFTDYRYTLMSSDMDMCYVHDTVKLPQFSPYFLRFFLHQQMLILPCTEYNPLFDRFFGTVWVTWSMTQRRSNWARNSLLGCCVSTSSLDAFSLSMWPKSEKERKSGIYIAKDSSLENLMAVLWS